MEEECGGANEVAFAGKQWIEDHPAADMKGWIWERYTGGLRAVNSRVARNM